MSFILEALKKVERERAARETATLHSIALGEKAPRRSRWPWVISGALVLNAAVAGALLWRHELWGGGTTADHAASKAVVAPGSAKRPKLVDIAREMKAPDPRTGPKVKAEIAKTAPMTPPAVDGSRSTQPVVATRSAETALPPRRPAPRERDHEVRDALIPSQPTPIQASGLSLGEEPEIATPQAAATVKGLEKKPMVPVPPEDPRLDGMPSYAEMPAEVQAAVPDLKVSLMAYAPNPAERLVYIKNRRYVEGDVIEDKLKVETITRRGVVLSYEGERFLLPP
ncbi:MAG: general secretion pathway protein GspB [Gammaproteobacteria bacterium]|nr:general secretion pathway protein GspB [Gammaproteobacteria bacterium]